MFFTPLCVDLESLCVELSSPPPLYVDLGSLYVDLTPHITKPPLAKHRFFVITITKTKRFFMGAFVGALFVRNINKTKNKHHLNRRYDSESGTANSVTSTIWLFFAFRDSGPGCALAFAVSDSSSGPTQQKIQYCRAKTRNIIQSRKHKPNGYAQ